MKTIKPLNDILDAPEDIDESRWVAKDFVQYYEEPKPYPKDLTEAVKNPFTSGTVTVLTVTNFDINP